MVRALTEDERAYYERQLMTTSHPRYYRCGALKCEEPLTHFVSYRYVTGRTGRVTTAEKRRCRTHAEAFALKHGISMPEDDPLNAFIVSPGHSITWTPNRKGSA